ncbi:MAG: DUF1614 domain-containing protein [Christensenellales bacterium]
MSISYIILSVLILALLFGAGQRILDKMRMNDRWAIIILLAIMVGMVIPPIKIGPYFSFSIGGFLIPFGICVYLLIKTGFSKDLLRAVIGTIITAGAVVAIQYIMPSNTPEDIVIDNVWLYGIVAGVVAYLLGRSRRNAFICSILGLFLSSVINFLIGVGKKAISPLSLGVAGAFDTIIISTIIAVGLSELMGKTVEAVSGKDESKVFNFETGEFVEIDEEQLADKKNSFAVDGLYKKMSIINYRKGKEKQSEKK